MHNNYKEERKLVAYFMRRLYKQGLTTSSGGNISARVSSGLIAITPTATDKGEMRWKEVGLLNMDGKNLIRTLKPSIEANLHLTIYRNMREVKAIVHAHPPFATAFTATGRTIDTRLTAEAWAIIGEPAFADYALMGTDLLAEKVASALVNKKVVLMENHGILAVGESLIEAYDRMEVLEAAAKMTLAVELMGEKRPLTKERLREIDTMMGK